MTIVIALLIVGCATAALIGLKHIFWANIQSPFAIAIGTQKLLKNCRNRSLEQKLITSSAFQLTAWMLTAAARSRIRNIAILNDLKNSTQARCSHYKDSDRDRFCD